MRTGKQKKKWLKNAATTQRGIDQQMNENQTKKQIFILFAGGTLPARTHTVGYITFNFDLWFLAGEFVRSHFGSFRLTVDSRSDYTQAPERILWKAFLISIIFSIFQFFFVSKTERFAFTSDTLHTIRMTDFERACNAELKRIHRHR